MPKCIRVNGTKFASFFFAFAYDCWGVVRCLVVDYCWEESDRVFGFPHRDALAASEFYSKYLLSTFLCGQFSRWIGAPCSNCFENKKIQFDFFGDGRAQQHIQTHTHTRTRSRSIMMIFLSTIDTITTVFFFLHKPIDSRRKNFCCLTLAQCTRLNSYSQRSTIFVFDKNKSIEWRATVFALTFALFFDGKTKKNEKLLKANGINVRIRVLNSRERDSLF